MMLKNDRKKVVVIGGGTGTYTVLRGLKAFADSLDITAVISMADSGGSTGRLRDEFGQLPVGDVRMALLALAEESISSQELLRELFLYRFDRGTGLEGHNFGNLFLTALTDITGSETEAIEVASKILRVKGKVLPVTTDNVHLTAVYDDGVEAHSEEVVDDPPLDRGGHRIVSLATKPEGMINPLVVEAVKQADYIVIGPGDLYSSLLANVVITGMDKALSSASAKIIYVSNLMERFGQTQGMSVDDCVTELTTYIKRSPNVVIVNKSALPVDVVARYQDKEGIYPVVDDADNSKYQVVRVNLVCGQSVSQQPFDAVSRSLIRHDSDKLAKILKQIFS